MKLKRVLAVVPVVLFLAVVGVQAQTVSSFAWFNSNPGSLSNPEGPIGSGNATVLTFLTPNSAFDPVAAMHPSLYSTWADVAADFSVYRALSNPVAGMFVTTQMAETHPDTFVIGQYAWAIVLDLPFASYVDLASVDNSIRYNVAGLSPVIINQNDQDNQATPQNFGGFTIMTTEVIPEPSVLALLGLGGLLMVVRRRFVRS